jgi:hypothetical protein
VKEIPLTQGKVALVSDGDFERVSKLKWHAIRHDVQSTVTWYAGTTYNRNQNGNRKVWVVRMHNFILGVKGIDHRDGDGLNNQRENLRRCSQSENCRNRTVQSHSSVFKGVSFNKIQQKWTAQIGTKPGVIKHLGTFSVEEWAAIAYDLEAEKVFGEFARTNRQMGLL